MCHRYNLRPTPGDIAETFEYLRQITTDWSDGDFYPTNDIPIIRAAEDGELELVTVAWGMVPAWWKPTGKQTWKTYVRKYSTFNARCETAHEKATFKSAFPHRRCLVPASEFYEGRKGHDAFFSLEKQPVMFFAGLWGTWQDVKNCTILTTQANELVAEYHPRKRMPVILPDDESRRLWMSPDVVERQPLEELFVPIDSTLMAHRSMGDRPSP